MRDFSTSEAIGAGFRLIGRNPVAVLFWAVVFLVLGLGPQMLVLSRLAPDMMAYSQDLAQRAAAGVKPDMGRAMALESRVFGLEPLLVLITAASQILVIAAVFRGVLQPQARRFGYLRLTRQELWLALSSLVLVVILGLVFLAAAIPTAIAAVAAGAAAGPAHEAGAAGWLMVLGVVAGLVVSVWLFLRLSLAPAMSFAEGRFRLFESWTLTRGRVLKLLGVAVALVGIGLGLELVLALAVALVFGALGAASGLQAAVGHSPAAVTHTLANWAPPALILSSIPTVAVVAVLAAPWAEIYRQLAAADTPAP